MRVSYFAACLVVGLTALIVAPQAMSAQPADKATPMIKTVTPEVAQIGQVVTGEGVALKSRVTDVYLTNGMKDFKVVLVEQTENMLKFKVPNGIPPGRYRLMVATPDNPPYEVEQPAVLTVLPGPPTGD